MAKKHVNLYYLQIQEQYLQMLDNMNDFKELAQEGKISQEDYDNALKEIDLLRANYERISYIILLLNKPKRANDKNEADKEAKVAQSWYDYLKGASKEAVLKEDADVLADLKRMIEEGKNK